MDNLTELTSQDLILRAMNETRNIERLALSIGMLQSMVFSGEGPKFQPIEAKRNRFLASDLLLFGTVLRKIPYSVLYSLWKKYSSS